MKIETLVKDIYDVVEKGVPEIPEDALLDLKAHIESIVKGSLLSVERAKNDEVRLRPSIIGLPDRKLWFTINHGSSKAESFDAARLLSFLYGHIVEALLLFLARIAGHVVTDTQKTVTVEGVTGSMDARIDGVPIDVKSASDYSFAKFADRSLLSGGSSDPFGYVGQISTYANGEDRAGFLAFNKSTGAIALLLLDSFDLHPDIKGRIRKAKEIIEAPEPPTEKCYPTEPFGKSGNESLHKLCTMCSFKSACWGDSLRVFQYAKGPVYLTKVVKEPDVPEITSGVSA